jgi:aarF domain-containing kinase
VFQQVLTAALGPSWSSFFTSFDRIPFAAASIGQVHAATLAEHVSPTGAEARVAVKVQFPNIASSIASDLGYVSMMLTAGRMLPKGLFLDRTMEVCGVSSSLIEETPTKDDR